MFIVTFKRKLIFGARSKDHFLQDERHMPVDLYRVVMLPFAPFPGLQVADNSGLWLATVESVWVQVGNGDEKVICTTETHQISLGNLEEQNREIVKNRVGAMLRAGWYCEAHDVWRAQTKKVGLKDAELIYGVTQKQMRDAVLAMDVEQDVVSLWDDEAINSAMTGASSDKAIVIGAKE